MTTTDRPYSRVYWSVLDDPKFDGIRDHAAHLGTWTLLLVVADMAYPSPAFLPPCPKASLVALANAQLIDLLSGNRYRVHGLEAERQRRSESGRAGASSRWNKGNADAMRPHSERNAVPLLDETETSTRRDEAEQTRDAAVALYDRTGRFPSPGLVKWLNRLTDRYGEARVTAAIDAAQPASPTTPGDYLTAAEDDLRRTEYAAEKAEQADEQRRLREKRAPAPISPAVAQLRAAMLAREQGGDAA